MVLAEAGGQTVLGPKISGLDFSDDPDLGLLPLGSDYGFLVFLCSSSTAGRIIQHSDCPSSLLNSITFICYSVETVKPYEKHAANEAALLKVLISTLWPKQ